MDDWLTGWKLCVQPSLSSLGTHHLHWTLWGREAKTRGTRLWTHCIHHHWTRTFDRTLAPTLENGSSIHPKQKDTCTFISAASAANYSLNLPPAKHWNTETLKHWDILKEGTVVRVAWASAMHIPPCPRPLFLVTNTHHSRAVLCSVKCSAVKVSLNS